MRQVPVTGMHISASAVAGIFLFIHPVRFVNPFQQITFP